MFIMRSTRCLIVATIAVVQIVSIVPGFAQSNSQYFAIVTADRTSAPVLRKYTPEGSWTVPSADVPPNLMAPPGYRRLLESMLVRSGTFRRQCQRIAATRDLLVNLTASGVTRTHAIRARTRIVRQGDLLTATIDVMRLTDPAEVIAHEIEHIIEQLDGIDLASKVMLDATGVRASFGDETAFETRRATRVGLIVADEVRRGGG
jgi:hypothetical protein